MNPITTRPKPTFLLTTLLVQLFAFGLIELILTQNSDTHHRTMHRVSKSVSICCTSCKGTKRIRKSSWLWSLFTCRSSNGQRAASRYYGWAELADKERFITAFPITNWNTLAHFRTHKDLHLQTSWRHHSKSALLAGIGVAGFH